MAGPLANEGAEAQSLNRIGGELKFERLKEKLFQDSNGGTQQAKEALEGPFKPRASDVDRFISEHLGFFGLSADDLKDISKNADKAGDKRQSQFADFVGSHFDDIKRLSSSRSGGGITRADMELYGQFLKLNEGNTGASSRNAAWSDAHYEHAMGEAKGLKVAGSALGFVAGRELLWSVAIRPDVAPKLLANPRTAIFGAAAAFVATSIAGWKGGDLVNRTVNGDQVRRHFYDQAEPALKRLME